MFKSELKRELVEAKKATEYYKRYYNETYEAKYKANRKYRKALKELASIAGITEQYTQENDYDNGTYFDADLLVSDLLKSAKELRKYTKGEEREIRLMGGLDIGYTDED